MKNLFDSPQPRVIDSQISLEEKLNWLRLFRTENVGTVTFYKLIEYYGSAGKALEALPEMARRGGRKKPLVAPPYGQIEKEYRALQKIGGDFLIAAEDDYPLALSALDDAPPVLSVLGRRDLFREPCIGMVGARNASLNGRKFAHKLAGDLGRRGCVVVSGLARGIDTAAHQGALETGTIAVVAGGIDVVYPEENKGLYDQIAGQGLIVAESPFGQKPFAQSFPRRNRIVSGLSKGVVVVEATMRSGSLITARLAGEQGRDVYAVPGHPFDPRSAGPNHLIRDGATLVRSADDVMESLLDYSGTALRDTVTCVPPLYPSNDAGLEDDIPGDAHENLLQNLSFTPISVDELIRSCEMSTGQIQTILIELELAGRIKRHSGNRVSLVGE